MFYTLKEIISIHFHQLFRIIRAGWVDIEKETDGAFFGWFWLFAKPVIYVTMFSLAMGVGLRQSKSVDSQAPYIIWLAAGLIPWFFMSSIFSKGSKVFSSKKKLYKIGAFSLLSLPSIASIIKIFVFLISFGLLLILALVLGVKPSVYWLQLPIMFLIMYAFYYFFSLLSSCISTVSTDYQKLVGTISMIFFWTSGIFFDATEIDNQLFKAYLTINPFSFVVNGFRQILAADKIFFVDEVHLIGFAIVLLLTIIVSCSFFNRLKPVIQDEMQKPS